MRDGKQLRELLKGLNKTGLNCLIDNARCKIILEKSGANPDKEYIQEQQDYINIIQQELSERLKGG